ncbi:MAG: hypothetical protein U0L70_07540 [Ruminococcus sp.]|nr:hypothetical protein [Ruminococcus sp.]
MNEENKVLTPNETPETTVEDTKETAPVKVAISITSSTPNLSA